MALSRVTDFSVLIEQFFVNLFKAKFFSRTPQKDEVDLVITGKNRVIPVEVKIKPDIKRRDAKPLFKFLKKYKLKKGYIISAKTEDMLSDSGYLVEIIPYWKYWSIKRKINYQAL
jgi:predicted AAA+ superfamily ATPase